MSENIFALGFSEKIAASSNPAAPQKTSLKGMESSSPSTSYLNQGGGSAGKQVAGDIKSRPQPWPGYVNHSKGTPTQVAGDVGGRSGAPDTGEMGSAGGDTTLSKSASAFDIGVHDMTFHVAKENEKIAALIEISDDEFEEICALDDNGLKKLALSPQTIGSAMGKRMRQAGIKGKGMAAYSPKNLKKTFNFGNSKKGLTYTKAIVRSGDSAAKAVGGGKSGLLARALSGRKASKAANKSLIGK